jgi:hypothetical protein
VLQAAKISTVSARLDGICCNYRQAAPAKEAEIKL